MQTDSTYIQYITTSDDYQYLDEIDGMNISRPSDTSHYTESISISNKFYKVLYELSKPLGSLLIIAIIILIIWRLKKKFSADMDTEETKGMGHDTIYDHDWQSEISEKYSQGKYSDVVVLAYLYKLRLLNDNGVIKFAKHKTPGMLEDEIKNHPTVTKELYDGVHWLTNSYLRIRYGHRKANEALANEALTIAGVNLNTDTNPHGNGKKSTR